VYEIEWSEEARADMHDVPPFVRGALRAEILRLRFQALFETKNRRPLKHPIAELPDAQWQSRVDAYRILYRVIGTERVRVLRVILKGSLTTADALKRS
jgi:hypothetical protein